MMLLLVVLYNNYLRHSNVTL